MSLFQISTCGREEATDGREKKKRTRNKRGRNNIFRIYFYVAV